MRGGVAQWVAHPIQEMSVVGSNPIKDSRCLLEQETLPSLRGTG